LPLAKRSKTKRRHLTKSRRTPRPWCMRRQSIPPRRKTLQARTSTERTYRRRLRTPRQKLKLMKPPKLKPPHLMKLPRLLKLHLLKLPKPQKPPKLSKMLRLSKPQNLPKPLHPPKLLKQLDRRPNRPTFPLPAFRQHAVPRRPHQPAHRHLQHRRQASNKQISFKLSAVRKLPKKRSPLAVCQQSASSLRYSPLAPSQPPTASRPAARLKVNSDFYSASEPRMRWRQRSASYTMRSMSSDVYSPSRYSTAPSTIVSTTSLPDAEYTRLFR